MASNINYTAQPAADAGLYAPISADDILGDEASEQHRQEDLAEADDGAMTLNRLEQILEDQRFENNWRAEADLAADYYDGNQLSRDTVEKLAEKGLGALVRNLVAPTVDAILGLEERSRLDWRVTSDFDDQMEIAEALTVKLTEAERETGADRALSDGYKGAIVSGFAAIEVSRQTNPFLYPYRCTHVHRREIGWDWRSRMPDWSDARYVFRKRWYDADIVAAHFPQFAKVIRAASGGEASWQMMLQMANFEDTALLNAFSAERATTVEDSEWRDIARKRVCVYELHYRTFHRGIILKSSRGQIHEYDPNNMMHVMAVASGRIKPVEAVYDKYRCAYFVGPHRLADFSTDRRRFPYIPIWGKREDLTGAPYGVVRSMMSVQDEINSRLAKMMWYLTARRTIIDDDAVDGKANKWNTLSDLSKEVGRADAFIVLNAGRRNANALTIDANMQLADSQHKAMLDAVNAMPMVTGIYATMLGQQTGTTAASAISQLLEQGTNTLAEINANFLYARRSVGQALLELCKEDLIEPMEVEVDTGVTKKKIRLNQKTVDPQTGISSVENNVAASVVKVQLDDVPATPSYRAKQFAQIAEVLKSMPPDLQAILAPFLIETSDLTMRKQAAKLIRDKLGIGADPNTPEGQQMLQAQQAAQQIQQAAAQAEIAVKQSQAAKFAAEAEKIKTEIVALADPNHPEHGNERRRYELELRKIEVQEKEIELNREINTLRVTQEEGASAKMAQVAQELDEQIAALAEKLVAERESQSAGLRDLQQTVKTETAETARKLQEQIDRERHEAEMKRLDDQRKVIEKELKAKEAQAKQRETDSSKQTDALASVVEAVTKSGEATAKSIEKAMTAVVKEIADVVQSAPPSATSKTVSFQDPVTGKPVVATIKSK